MQFESPIRRAANGASSRRARVSRWFRGSWTRAHPRCAFAAATLPDRCLSGRPTTGKPGKECRTNPSGRRANALGADPWHPRPDMIHTNYVSEVTDVMRVELHVKVTKEVKKIEPAKHKDKNFKEGQNRQKSRVDKEGIPQNNHANSYHPIGRAVEVGAQSFRPQAWNGVVRGARAVTVPVVNFPLLPLLLRADRLKN